ncbi:MAG TPA: hypothetical protein VJ743_16905, partial [Albitalea sp.]|nr:hypothetical protein [Albitalea sp.]
MKRLRLLPLAAAAVCLGALVPGRASAIEVSAVCTSNVGLNGDQVGHAVTDEDYGPSPAQCFASEIDAIGGESGHGQSQGYAGIGLQRASSFANADISLNGRPETSGSSNVLGDSQVRVVDRFRMASGHVAPGSWLSVTMGYYVVGTVDSSGLGIGSGWNANAGWGVNDYAVTLVQGASVLAGSSGEQRFMFGAVNSREDTSDGSRFNGLHQLSFNVLAGSSIDLYISLRALSFALAYASTEAPLGVVHSSADMGHSITWA